MALDLLRTHPLAYAETLILLVHQLNESAHLLISEVSPTLMSSLNVTYMKHFVYVCTHRISYVAYGSTEI